MDDRGRDRVEDFILWYGLPYLIAVPVGTALGAAAGAMGMLLGWT